MYPDQRAPPQRLDPKAPRAHDVVKTAARKGFTVTYYPSREEYYFRHRLGRVRFYLADLNDIDYRDLEVWQ